MKTLSFKDIHQVLKSIRELYYLDDLNPFEIKALAILNRLVPSEVPTFFRYDSQLRQVSYGFLPGCLVLTPKIEQILACDCQEYPVFPNLPLSFGGVYSTSYFIDREVFYPLQGLYRQFMGLIECQEQILVLLQSWHDLAQLHSNLVGFALNRRQSNFSKRDRLILTFLRPHLLQAYQNARHLQRLQQDAALLQASLEQALEEPTLPQFKSLQLLGLSPREAEILAWVMRGKDNKAIAAELGIHIGTVRKHLEHIYLKLGVQSRTEAIAKALEELGVLNSPPFL